MPLVRIDAPESQSAEDLAAVGDGVHRALVQSIGIPEQDRFQVLSRHAAGLLVFDRHYLGISRSDGVVFVQITMSTGRSVEQKKALFAAIVRNLGRSPGIRSEDVFVNLVEVVKENWSFGNGVAQYA
ncbi:MAG TPA: tautomerase family protein [Thermoanaerobaculia bacterium]|nr:tautomerase family protein [Thermoanaerobaculia bacterium]